MLTAVKWYDNSSVCLLLNFLTSHPTTICRRHDKTKIVFIDVPLPNIISECNKDMGGVDLHDQQMLYYRMSFKCKKYHMRLIFCLIDIVAVNSWKLLQRTESSLKIEYINSQQLNTATVIPS